MHNSGYAIDDIHFASASTSHQPSNTSNHSSSSSSSSIADELMKLGKLKEHGIITEEEFIKLKKDVLEGMR
jgi:Short C-terminal domain